MCAYISRVERKKERRKKIFFWSFIIADILCGLWMGIFSFNKSTKIIEGEITPGEKLIREEGVVTDWKYVYNIGTKYNKSEHYFMIELDNMKAYKIKTYALDAFDRKKFEKFGTGIGICSIDLGKLGIKMVDLKNINNNIISSRWKKRYAGLSDEIKVKLEKLDKTESSEYQLQVIKRKRIYPQIGDIFKINPKDDIYLYGIVVNNHINNIGNC